MSTFSLPHEPAQLPDESAQLLDDPVQPDEPVELPQELWDLIIHNLVVPDDQDYLFTKEERKARLRPLMACKTMWKEGLKVAEDERIWVVDVSASSRAHYTAGHGCHAPINPGAIYSLLFREGPLAQHECLYTTTVPLSSNANIKRLTIYQCTTVSDLARGTGATAQEIFNTLAPYTSLEKVHLVIRVRKPLPEPQWSLTIYNHKGHARRLGVQSGWLCGTHLASNSFECIDWKDEEAKDAAGETEKKTLQCAQQ